MNNHKFGDLFTYLVKAVLHFGAFFLELREVAIRQVLAERKDKKAHERVHESGQEKREAPRGEGCGVEAVRSQRKSCTD